MVETISNQIPFFVHTDTGKEEIDNSLPYKNVVVPLTNSIRESTGYTVTASKDGLDRSHKLERTMFIAKTDYNHKIEDYTSIRKLHR